MENNINVEKSGKKKSFSFNWFKSRIVSVFSKKKWEIEDMKLDENESNVVIEEEIQPEKTDEKLQESFIDKAKSTVKWTLSDLNNTFATVSNDDTKKEEKIDYKKEFDNVRYLKNWNVAVLKKDCFVALWARRRDFWWVYNKKWDQIIPVCYLEIKELENWIFACKWIRHCGSYDQFDWTLYDEDWDIIVSHVGEYLLKDGDLFVNYSPYSSTYWMINKQWKRIFPKKYFWNLDSQEKLENRKDGFRPYGFEYRPLGFDYNPKRKPELWLKILEYKDGEVDRNTEECYWMWEFKDGVMLYKVPYWEKKWYFDENFNLIVPWVYDEVWEFKDWVVLLCKYSQYDNSKKEYSFKKKDGKSLWKKKEIWRWWMFETDMTYDDAHEFKDGVAAVNKDNLWWFIDNNGNAITNLEFTEVSDFSDGKAEVVKRVGWKVIKFWINKKWEYLLWKNDTVEDFEKYEKKLWKDVINLLRLWKNYQEIVKISEWIYAVKWYKWKAYRLINLEWAQIDWIDFYAFKKLKNWMIKIETKNEWWRSKWYILDNNWKRITENFFGEVREFEDWIAAVCVKVGVYWWFAYRWKFINEKGEFINDKMYYKVRDFENWKAKVREEKDWEKYYIDVNWNRID